MFRSVAPTTVQVLTTTASASPGVLTSVHPIPVSIRSRILESPWLNVHPKVRIATFFPWRSLICPSGRPGPVVSFTSASGSLRMTGMCFLPSSTPVSGTAGACRFSRCAAFSLI